MSSIPFIPIGPQRMKPCPLVQIFNSPPAANDPDRGEEAPATRPSVTGFKPKIVS